LLCIIADDLTGAFDAAAPFAARGISVAVALHPRAMADALRASCDVVAVSTQSRETSPNEAAARVAEVAASVPRNARVFKKVDSRLKGNIAAELAALAPCRMLVAPAIPEFGRIVSGGQVSGFGVDDPISVRDALGALATVAEVPDTLTNVEMLAALRDVPGDALLVGARGLAEALAVEMTGQADAPLVQRPAGKLLVVVGSCDPITVAQVDRLRERGHLDWRGAPNGRMVDSAPLADLTVVQTTPGATAASGHAVAEALAESVHPSLTLKAAAIFLTGGATAEAVLQRMGLDVLRLAGEVLPGVPLSWAGHQAIILKSGGFGDRDTLLRLDRDSVSLP
jgi:uncharacterized protein YgbK (DUF1537 family)